MKSKIKYEEDVYGGFLRIQQGFVWMLNTPISVLDCMNQIEDESSGMRAIVFAWNIPGDPFYGMHHQSLQ